jgi:hypothetical protein
MAIAGNCANCGRPTDQHHPRCPTLTYPQVDSVYYPRHAAPSFPTEPEPAETRRTWRCGECGMIAGHHVTCSHHAPIASASIFDAPDAATTHAKQTAQALIHEYQTFASQPGHWTADQAAAWIGQACAVLTELAK